MKNIKLLLCGPVEQAKKHFLCLAQRLSAVFISALISWEKEVHNVFKPDSGEGSNRKVSIEYTDRAIKSRNYVPSFISLDRDVAEA